MQQPRTDVAVRGMEGGGTAKMIAFDISVWLIITDCSRLSFVVVCDVWTGHAVDVD